MPVLNGAALFSRAIESILSQTYPDFEVVISDNASSDGTADLVKKYAAMDSRVRPFRQPATVSGLLNYKFVWEQARGEYFFWAPHDDWWNAEFIAAAVKALDTAPQAVAAMGAIRYMSKDGKEIGVEQPPYFLNDPDPFLRIKSYLERNVTDGLYYAVFRREVLQSANWRISTSADKVIIMHVLGKGPIVDGWDMEYFNQLSFKTAQEVLEAYRLPESHPQFDVQIFFDLLAEIRKAVRVHEYIMLAVMLVQKQNWHKAFAKQCLAKIRFKPIAS